MSGQVLSQYVDSGGRTWLRVACDCDGLGEDCLSCDWQERGVTTVLACDECGAFSGYCTCDNEDKA